MEAWEKLCPEDLFPPGAPTGITPLGHLPNPENAWRAFTQYTKITRKRYAEFIAMDLVREVVLRIRRFRNCTLAYHNFIALNSVHHCIKITDVDSYGEVFTVEMWEGPTLCDAAWECIQELNIEALGGGE